MQVVHHGGFIQVCQLSHIIGLVELCRVDFVNLIRVDLPLLLSVVRKLSTTLKIVFDSYLAIVALYHEPSIFAFFQH